MYVRMGFEVINVFEPFFAFAHTFNSTHAHNMCAFQLDPQFKQLQCIMEYVGRDMERVVLKEYDQHVLVHLLVIIYKLLKFWLH